MTILGQQGEEDDLRGLSAKAQPLVLLFLDGFGVAPINEGNIFSQLKLKTLAGVIRDYPVILLSAIFGSVNQRYFSLGLGEEKSEEEMSLKKELPCLSSIVSESSLKQLKIFESERFAPLSYFFNGLRENKLDNEEWCVVSSTDKNGKQRSQESLTKNIFLEITKALNSDDTPDLIVVSVSGIDTLARAGDIEALKKEILLIDRLLHNLTEKVLEKNARLLITSAFGNAEKILDIGMEIRDNKPTQNPVPLIFIGQDFAGLSAGKGDVLDSDMSSLPVLASLIDLTPTVLELLYLTKKDTMRGVNLARNIV